jgi:trk system potassium uptake protein TrkA
MASRQQVIAEAFDHARKDVAMKVLSILLVVALAFVLASALASILGADDLTIDFTDAKDAKAKATWSDPNRITVTDAGLGWDGQQNALRDTWIQTTSLAVGLSWRPAQSVNITAEVEPRLKPIALDDGKTFLPYVGNMFVRHSPDGKHWSSWQAMQWKGSKDDDRSKREFTASVALPTRDRKEYTKLMRQYQELDVPWKSDEEALVKWIIQRDPEFFKKHTPFIGYVQDPVEALANELLLLVGRGGASEVVEFAGGKINLFGGYVHAGSLLDGITLRELRGRVTGWEWIVGAVVRNGDTFIARGDSQIEVGDHVLIMANGDAAHEALELMGVDEHKAKKVFILGSTRLAVLTAENLVRAGISTVLVDIEADGCDELSAKYDRLVIVKGDPTDINVLKSEGVDTADIVIGATGWDEVNVLGCLVAKALGAETTVARFSRIEYASLLAGNGIDAGVSTRLAAANEILRHIRRGQIYSVATFQDTTAEAIEFQVGDESEAIGRTLHDIGLPKSAIVGGIVRGKDAFIPHGTTEIQAGDRLIAIALPEAIPSVEKLFA